MNNDPGDPFHHTTGFHSDQHGSAEASSDFGGLSSLFDQYYDYMGDFGENVCLIIYKHFVRLMLIWNLRGTLSNTVVRRVP